MDNSRHPGTPSVLLGRSRSYAFPRTRPGPLDSIGVGQLPSGGPPRSSPESWRVPRYCPDHPTVANDGRWSRPPREPATTRELRPDPLGRLAKIGGRKGSGRSGTTRSTAAHGTAALTGWLTSQSTVGSPRIGAPHKGVREPWGDAGDGPARGGEAEGEMACSQSAEKSIVGQGGSACSFRLLREHQPARLSRCSPPR
jgi:hypothetical protein